MSRIQSCLDGIFIIVWRNSKSIVTSVTYKWKGHDFGVCRESRGFSLFSALQVRNPLLFAAKFLQCRVRQVAFYETTSLQRRRREASQGQARGAPSLVGPGICCRAWKGDRNKSS